MQDIAFFPGCSLATSAKENYESMRAFCQLMGYNLVEVEDWNCCGTSSAHSLDPDLGLDLASRNLSRIPQGQSLLVACPSCYIRLKQSQLQIKVNARLRERFEQKWQQPFDPGQQIIPFLSFLSGLDITAVLQDKSLNNLKLATYYGCMLARPPIMSRDDSHYGVMEKTLVQLGARPCLWPYKMRCCGTFLSVARPEIVTPIINTMFASAINSGAECIVTACSMCHMNLEIRCTRKEKIPVFHFSELLALAAGWGAQKDWFNRHLIDPGPLLKSRGFL